MKKKQAFVVLYLFNVFIALSQTDTVRGEIKIARARHEKIYIKAQIKFDDLDFSQIEGTFVNNEVTPPAPVVPGYSLPFNYTSYFNNQFKNKSVDFENYTTDTIRMYIKVLPNGKVYIKDKSNSMMLNGSMAYYDPKLEAYKIDKIHLYCFDFLKGIKWIPAYVTKTKIRKLKKQQVIVPYKINVPASGILTILFSSTPFDE